MNSGRLGDADALSEDGRLRKHNAVLEKSYAFAVRIVRLYQHISEARREYVLSKQVLRSGTSIGANVEEAVRGVSKKDFMFKMGVAYKEARETTRS